MQFSERGPDSERATSMLVTDRGDNLGDTFEMLMTVLLPVSRIIVADFGTAYFSFAYFLCTFSNMF